MKLIEGGIPRYNVLQNGSLMLSSNVYYLRMFLKSRVSSLHCLWSLESSHFSSVSNQITIDIALCTLNLWTKHIVSLECICDVLYCM